MVEAVGLKESIQSLGIQAFDVSWILMGTPKRPLIIPDRRLCGFPDL